MKIISASAPGKAIISGEYAVLRGAPAISAAIDCRARVVLRASCDEYHSVTTAGYGNGIRSFSVSDKGIFDWHDSLPDGSLRLVEEAWRACRFSAASAVSVSIDTREFYDADTGSKFGVGSSAAAMTALVAAFCRYSGRTDIAPLASEAHSAFQGGVGSGVDVATSIHGGVIQYRVGGNGPPHDLGWPDGLEAAFVWVGNSTSTTDRLSRLKLDEQADDSWTRLVSEAKAVSHAWAHSEATVVLKALRRYSGALEQFSVDHALDIFDAGHSELVERADSMGVLYKPCGAGGGDIGVALAEDDTLVREFCGRATQAGFLPLPCAPGAPGVQVTVKDEC